MNTAKEEIIREFLNKGKLLTPEALRIIESEGGVEEITSGLVVNGADVKETMKTKPEIKIIKNITTRTPDTSTEDVAAWYRSRYEKIKRIVTMRLHKNFVSLNKLDNYRDEVYVAGLVRDVKEADGKYTIELDDSTASIPVIFEAEHEAVPGDVVAVRAVSARNVLFGKEVIFPDVPLRSAATGYGRACAISNILLDEAPRQDIEQFFSWLSGTDLQFLFIAGGFGDRAALEGYIDKYCSGKKVFVIAGEKDTPEKYPRAPLEFSGKNVVSLSDPSVVEVNGLSVLLASDFDIDMLRKRRLGQAPRPELVLDIVPDIVVHGGEEPQILNYKSITIANSGSMLTKFKPVVINFETREASYAKIQ